MIILTDLDGTLTDQQGVISEPNYHAIQGLRTLGVAVVLATGRPSRVLSLPPHQTALFDEIIACNGAERIRSGRAELVAPLPSNVLKAIVTLSARPDLSGTYAVEYGSSFGYEPDYASWPATDRDPNAVVGSLAELCQCGREVAKVLFKANSPVSPDTIAHMLQSHLGPTVCVTHSNPLGTPGPVEITTRKANKGAAAREFLRSTHRKLGIVVAFGDQLNDLTLLELGDYSFAVGDAHPALTARFPRIPNDHYSAVSDVLMRGVRSRWLSTTRPRTDWR